MKRRIVSALLLFALLPASACNKPAEPPAQSQPAAASSEAAKIEFTDALGQEFSLVPPERVVVLIGSFADVWLLAGGQDMLVATANDAWESYGLDLGENVANIGSAMKPNVELVLAAEPDLVIASSQSPSNLEMRETFDRAGIPAAYFDVSSFRDYLDLLELFTRLTGRPENFETYGTRVKAQVDEARRQAALRGYVPAVLTIQVSGSSVRVKNSEDNVLGPMLKELGCVNIADRDGALLEDLSLEAILAADPDYIFVVLQGSDPTKAQETLDRSLLSHPAWSSLRAVREGRFYTLDHALYNLKPNARWGEAYEKLADILYPE